MPSFEPFAYMSLFAYRSFSQSFIIKAVLHNGNGSIYAAAEVGDWPTLTKTFLFSVFLYQSYILEI